MSVKATADQDVTEVVERHRALYEGPEVEARLRRIIKHAPQSKLAEWDVHRILRSARSVFFDSHVEVVSGHHTGTYLRFESIARIPQLVTLIARDMADWITQRFALRPISGVLVPASDAQILAHRIAELLPRQLPLRVVTAPFNRETGRIGAEVESGTITPGERFVALNDVTTRGNCVNKLGTVITNQGGVLAGMMVFARRDSGQFPLMDELMAKHPFFCTTDLDMPQWEAGECPLCRKKEPLLSWRDLPEL